MTGFVTQEWLADRLGKVVVVDVRDGWEYDGIGHLPTAVSIPFDEFRADEHAARADGQGQGMLPGEETWESLLGEAGIAPEDDIVAYDDTHGVFAARFLVTAELYGHDPEKLHLLDGDFSAWQREREVSRDAPVVESTTYDVSPPTETPLVDMETVAAAVDGDAVLVDTRDDREFEAGHIPGAVQFDWREVVEEDSRGLKPLDEIETMLADRGITPDKRLVLYCNTARRISHTYVVLRHLGYERLEFYEGSLSEWEAAGRPLETV
ncbi:sulfurtransferase [Halapricum salinum]|uniref:Sulfurtransferase n=1 Tax=Halapricum salinum TaxID=1457250 RepID=A0A4D6HDD9_9EURY|nr:sulfurtransferase [Halapricum salinum]QCC51082.1 sulfurtransferase [Halapricum salinum]